MRRLTYGRLNNRWMLIGGTPGTVVGFGVTADENDDGGIKRYGDITTADCENGEDEQKIEEIVMLGTRFGILTEYTAFLAREGTEPERDQTPEERADSLTADILSREPLRVMTRNPLLCTLIVMVHRSRSGHLPHRRFVFYEAAVNTVVEYWERSTRSPKQDYVFPEPAGGTSASVSL